MRFSSSILIWNTILFVTCYIEPKSAEACDEAFKESLLAELRSAILGDFKTVLLDDFKQILDTKMNLVNERLDESEYALNLVAGSVSAIEGEMEAVTGRSSEAQLNIREMKTMQENMTTQLVSLKDTLNVDIKAMQENMTTQIMSLKESLNDVENNLIEMNKIDNDTYTAIQTMGNNTQQQIQYISESLEGYQELTQIMNNGTIEIIQKIEENLLTVSNNSNDILQKMEQNKVILNDSFEDILTKTIKLGNDISLIKRETQITSDEMTAKLKSSLQIVSNPIMDISAKLATVISKATTLGENMGELRQLAEDSSTDIKEQLVSLSSEQDASSFKISAKLDIIEKVAGCPAGYFQVDATGQCFKYYDYPHQSWTAAKAKCEAEGLVLAKPYDPLALRRYIIMRFGSGSGSWSWLGARGVGSSVQWIRDNETLLSGSPLWYSGHYDSNHTSSTYCLMFGTNNYMMENFPDTPYGVSACTHKRRTICELPRE